jgi:hypothetical protein
MMGRPSPQIEPHFSGHETFTLRYGWLKKAYDAVKDSTEGEGSVFRDGATARFGVGKNMVSSIRHWATASGVICKKESVTEFGRFLFDDKSGRDPYMENPNTAWVVHWNLSHHETQKTTWFWAFNLFHEIDFEREVLERGLQKLSEDQDWKRVAESTIKRDVACFIRTYAAQPVFGRTTYEDAIESPLTELGLLNRIGRRDKFRFVRGPKRSLGIGAFGYALAEFWRTRFKGSMTLAFDALAHQPGSPGRVFLLDENSLYNLCEQLEEVSGGIYRWSETAGLRQMVRTERIDRERDFELLSSDYS